MTNFKTFLAAATLALVLSAGSLAAKTKPIELQDLRERNATLVQRIVDEDPATMKKLQVSDQKKIKKLEEDLSKIIGGATQWADLIEPERVKVVNLNNEIWAIVADASDNVNRCQTVRKTGSHMSTTRCRTRKEEQEEMADAQDYLDDSLQQRAQLRSGN
jgi:hypothetical protein